MSKAEPDIFIYKMVADSGGAPCVFKGVLSLAICKPKIRKSAKKGALIFGFDGKNYQERLIYIARVTDRLAGRAYYQRRKYARRPDCIYRVRGDGPVLKASARFHVESDQRKKDVGFDFRNASVLLSKDFRYLGKLGTSEYKHEHQEIRKLVEGLKRGHRRHLSPTLRDELLALKRKIWRQYRRKRVGTPSDDDRSRRCNTECPSASC
jgi:hypothetical protein